MGGKAASELFERGYVETVQADEDREITRQGLGDHVAESPFLGLVLAELVDDEPSARITWDRLLTEGEPRAMTRQIWYLESVFHSGYSRGYVPVGEPTLTERENRQIRMKINARARAGTSVAPEELPDAYVHKPTDPDTRLDLPLWHSAFVQVRDDVVAVLRRFDLGATVLRPITVELADGKGLDTRYATLLTSNVRPTIDPERSEEIGYGAVKRGGLLCNGEVHPGVRAFPEAADGPAVWTDPDVDKTVFVNDELARALLAEPFGADLRLKQISLK